MEGIKIWEVKLSLFVGAMILYIENHKESTKKLIELINEISKVSRYKINIQKSVAVLHANNELSEKEFKKIIPFTVASKKSTIPRNKFNQECKRLVLKKILRH